MDSFSNSDGVSGVQEVHADKTSIPENQQQSNFYLNLYNLSDEYFYQEYFPKNDQRQIPAFTTWSKFNSCFRFAYLFLYVCLNKFEKNALLCMSDIISKKVITDSKYVIYQDIMLNACNKKEHIVLSYLNDCDLNLIKIQHHKMHMFDKFSNILSFNTDKKDLIKKKVLELMEDTDPNESIIHLKNSYEDIYLKFNIESMIHNQYIVDLLAFDIDTCSQVAQIISESSRQDAIKAIRENSSSTI